MTERDKPIETPYHQRMENFRRRTVPLLVWSLSAVLCVVVLYNRASHLQYVGMAEALEYEVSSSARGTLEAVIVGLYDDIEAGQLVAKLDDSRVLASIETSKATIRQLGAELDAARVQVLTDTASLKKDLRRFLIDEEQRRLDLLELRVIIESDQIEVERLALEQQRAERLLDAGLVGQMDYDNQRLLYDQVQKRVEENQVLLAQTRDELEAASERRVRYERDLPGPTNTEPVLQPLREAVAVESRRLREIEVLRESLLLRSPVAGQVSQILCRRGQSVVPGEPIVMVAERSPREIYAYLSEPQGVRVDENTPVLVASRNNPKKVAESIVIRVSPTIQPLPQRLWRDPRTPDYGRAVVIAGVPALGLTPGELVSVSLRSDD